ncbi:hypothetical protein GEMRC1_005388 [Eukaryota sp. GEM-RC1]
MVKLHTGRVNTVYALQTVNLSNENPKLQSLLLIFELGWTSKLPINITLSHDPIDFSCGTICADSNSNTSLKSLSKALYSNVPIKHIKFDEFRSLSFGGIVALFEILLFSSSITDVGIEPHSIEFCTDIITFEEEIYNNDLDYYLKAIKSNIPTERVKCEGLREPYLEGLIASYQIHSINKSVIDLDVSHHSFDISLGSIRYDSFVNEADLMALLIALKSNVRITRVECLGVEEFLSL